MPSDIESRDLDALVPIVENLPHCRALGLEVVDLAPGRGTLKLPWRAELVGNPETGVLHGGAVTALLDTLGGLVVYSAIPENTAVATLDLRIDYFKPARAQEAVFGHAEVIKLTSNVAFVEGFAYQGEAANRIAHCTGSFMVGSVGFAVA